MLGILSLASAAFAVPAARYQPPGSVHLVSTAFDGGAPNGTTIRPSLSADGRFVAFFSWASNLVPGDTNAAEFEGSDVFVRDRVEGTIERVSVTSSGAQVSGNSYVSSNAISADGRYVAFESSSANLVPGDTNATSDIFVHDRVTKETVRVSVGPQRAQSNGLSWLPSISADGSAVVFWSRASNLAQGEIDTDDDLFVHDLRTGKTEWISHGPDRTAATPHWSFFPECLSALSADASRVVFCSESAKLVAGDTNEAIDVFVHDRGTDQTQRVSINNRGIQGNTRSGQPAISDDGNVVAFFSGASNLILGDRNSTYDVFVRDLVAGTTERVSVSSAGAEGDYPSYDPSLSADGRYVGFDSPSNTFVPGVAASEDFVFVHDRLTRQTELVSVRADGTLPNGWAMRTELTPDGRYVGFDSSASNLVPPGLAAEVNVLVADRGPEFGIGELHARRSGERAEVSGWVRLGGSELSRATDPSGDASQEVGGDLTGARVVYRPEEADLLVDLALGDLLSTNGEPVPDQGVLIAPGVAGTPGLTYGMRFEVAGVAHEVRATLAEVDGQPRAQSIALFRCAPTCTRVAELAGGIGTIASTVQASVPLSTIGAGDGTSITNISAFTRTGLDALGSIDRVDLPNAAVPALSVLAGAAEAGMPVGEGRLGSVPLDEGRFAFELPLTQQESEVLVRLCLGSACRSTRSALAGGQS